METKDFRYFRARVRNEGNRPAKGALVFVTSLEKVYPGGSAKQVMHDSMPLSWAGWNFKPREIPPAKDVHIYVDIVRFSKNVVGWSFSVDQMFKNYADLQSFDGTYRFTLVVTAHNAKPETLKLDVTYNNVDWRTSSAMPVKT